MALIMDSFSDVWHVIERVAGVFLIVCFCLYLVRCLCGWQILTFDQFDRFFRGLVLYIFR
jgi:hypothetical protein